MAEDEITYPLEQFRSVTVVRSSQTGRYAPIVQANGPPDYGYSAGIGTSGAQTTITLNTAIGTGQTFYAREIDITSTASTAVVVTFLDNVTVVASFQLAAGTTLHLQYNVGIPFSTSVKCYATTGSAVNVGIAGILAQ